MQLEWEGADTEQPCIWGLALTLFSRHGEWVGQAHYQGLTLLVVRHGEPCNDLPS